MLVSVLCRSGCVEVIWRCLATEAADTGALVRGSKPQQKWIIGDFTRILHESNQISILLHFGFYSSAG